MEISWQNCFGGTKAEYTMDMLEINNGYLIVGYTYSDDGDISFNHGNNDGWILSIDSIGNLIWEKSFGGSSGDGIVRIFPASNNLYYLLGAATSSDGDVSYDPYPNSADFWILKIDNLGNIIWDRIVGTTHYDHIYSGTTTNDGGIIAIGWAGINDGDKSVWYGYYDMWMIKLNSEGETEWDFTIGGSDFDFPHAIIQTSDGGYLVGGTSIVEPGGNLTCKTHGLADAILVKLDSARNIEWQQCYGGSGYDGVFYVMELDDGYLFSGYAGSNDGNISGWHGGYDLWVVKVDFYGNIIWQKCLGGSKNESAENVFQTEDFGYLIVGYTSSDDGDVNGNHSIGENDNDIWLVKLSSEGELLWQQCIGGKRNEYVEFGVLKKDDYCYVIAGQTDNSTYDVQCELHGFNDDFWVFEIKDCSLYMPETPLMPAGPDSLCTTTDTTAVYVISPAAGAWYYEWMLSPEEAGSITGSGIEATVNWIKNWEGQAEIKVRSANDCGYSDWSEPHLTWAFSCMGIGELHAGNIPVYIYPNPAGDYVVFEFKDKRQKTKDKNGEKTIRISNIFGQLVATLQVKSEKTVWDTREIKAGMYFYRVNIEGMLYCGKVIVRR